MRAPPNQAQNRWTFWMQIDQDYFLLFWLGKRLSLPLQSRLQHSLEMLRNWPNSQLAHVTQAGQFQVDAWRWSWRLMCPPARWSFTRRRESAHLLGWSTLNLDFRCFEMFERLHFFGSIIFKLKPIWMWETGRTKLTAIFTRKGYSEQWSLHQSPRPPVLRLLSWHGVGQDGPKNVLPRMTPSSRVFLGCGFTHSQVCPLSRCFPTFFSHGSWFLVLIPLESRVEMKDFWSCRYNMVIWHKTSYCFVCNIGFVSLHTFQIFLMVSGAGDWRRSGAARSPCFAVSGAGLRWWFWGGKKQLGTCGASICKHICKLSLCFIYVLYCFLNYGNWHC